MAELLARSPLEAFAFGPMPDLMVEERPVGSLVQVAAWSDTVGDLDRALGALGLPVMPAATSSACASGVTMMDVGPGRALIEAAEHDLFGRLRDAIAPEVGTVTDLSHARVRLIVEGPRAAWVLAKGVALDLHPNAFPVGCTAVTALDHASLILRRTDEAAFALYPYRGFALSLAEWLQIAGARDTP